MLVPVSLVVGCEEGELGFNGLVHSLYIHWTGGAMEWSWSLRSHQMAELLEDSRFKIACAPDLNGALKGGVTKPTDELVYPP